MENDAALEKERPASDNHNAENIVQLIQRAVPKTMESRQSTYAHGLVAVNSDVATPIIVVKSCVTKDRAEHAEMLSSKKSAVIADGQYSSPLYHVVHNPRLVDMNANDQRHVVIRRYPTVVTEMTKLVPSVHSLRPSPVCVGRTRSRTSLAISAKCAARRLVDSF